MYDLSGPIETRKETYSKEDIFAHVTDYQIFAYYIDDFKANKLIRSPLRNDKNPSWKVTKSKKGNLYYVDYSTLDRGDCFEFVKSLFNINYYQSLQKISYDLGVTSVNPNINSLINRSNGNIVSHVEVKKYSCKIGVNKVGMTELDMDYWFGEYGLDEKILKRYNIIKCSRIFLNTRVFWSSSVDNPLYAYVFYKDKEYTFKIYRPKANKGEKWLSNTNRTILQGWDQLPKTGEKLIITKSLKDVMVLDSLGYPSIAMQSEVSSIKDTVVDELYNRFNKIFILQDFDYAGVSGVNKLRKAYGFSYFFIQDFKTRGNGIKDISDHRAGNDFNSTKQLIDNYTNEIR